MKKYSVAIIFGALLGYNSKHILPKRHPHSQFISPAIKRACQNPYPVHDPVMHEKGKEIEKECLAGLEE